MECKDNTVRTWFRTIGSINRNIVECKVHRNCDLLCTLFRINRNIVECKAGTVLGKLSEMGSVLIETLWNVKQ